jgi:hypothetical protein
LADIGREVNETNVSNGLMVAAINTMIEAFTTNATATNAAVTSMTVSVGSMQNTFEQLSTRLIQQNDSIIELLRGRGPPTDN